MKVLFVDDNVDITTMLSKYLEIKGHSCTVENDGRNGLQRITNGEYDVILLDLAMPGFSGRDIISTLNKDGLMKNKLIIAFTASSIDDHAINDLKKYGIHSVLKKPIDPDHLIECLHEITTTVQRS